jgi:uncharacterized protein YbjQ (UPF0145 family)
MTTENDVARRAVEAARQTAATSTSVTTGSLASAEVLALTRAGYQPAGLVSGTSVTTIVTGWAARGRAGEIDSLTIGMTTARSSAVERLIAAARALGAVGVVDVRPRLTWRGRRRSHSLELTLLGTAVTGKGAHLTAAANVPACFVAAMDAVAVSRLAWSGWQPVGVVIGVSVFGFPRRRVSAFVHSSWHGSEALHQTEALYGAREAAMARLDADARALGADGVLGISLQQDAHVWGRRAVEISVIGTAVVRTQGGEQIRIPELAFSLADPKDELRTDLR